MAGTATFVPLAWPAVETRTGSIASVANVSSRRMGSDLGRGGLKDGDNTLNGYISRTVKYNVLARSVHSALQERSVLTVCLTVDGNGEPCDYCEAYSQV